MDTWLDQNIGDAPEAMLMAHVKSLDAARTKRIRLNNGSDDGSMAHIITNPTKKHDTVNHLD